jgi:H/ACA ribonucleoprotein complex subunit 4
VTGVLPIALSRACRLSDYFMHKNKTYVGIMRLHSDVSDKELNDAIDPLIGKIKQLPPVRSAVKREIREREVLSFEILERNGKDVLFKSEVEAGTYIRTLCVQIGEKIGGAHMLELRRIQAGIFSEEEIYTLYDFDKAVAEYKAGDEKMLRKMIIPAEIISTLLPVIQINDKKSLKQLLTGKPLMKSDCKKSLEEGIFCIFNKDIFIGVYKKVNEGDIIGRAEFIFN